MNDAEIVKEFVIESTENLERLDREMVALETRPDDAELLAGVFRTLHTIKGTCGFLNFSALEKITHQAENILAELRNGTRKLTPELVSVILDTVDAVKIELRSIESTSKESGAAYADLLKRQSAALKSQPFQASPAEFQTGESTPAAQAEAVPATDASKSSLAESTIRVDVSLLNKLMNLVGELVLVRNQILLATAGREDAAMNATSQKLNLITTELQGGVMKTRMQPIGMVWGKLPRIVRDLALSCRKQIALEMEGETTELDRTILEAIKDPLTHIVRNACDHGIELPEERLRSGKPAQGTLKLRAYHEGGNVNIEITDDGAGMDAVKIREIAVRKGLLRITDARLNDREVLNMIFVPGFSTAREVSNISGRGVGMDVVRTNIEKIGGHVDLNTKKGEGTTVKLKIPLTLAIIPGLVVTASRERFVIPQANLLELVRLEGDEALKTIEHINGTPLLRQRGNLLPLACLSDVLKLAESSLTSREVVNIAVLQAEEQRFGMIVDAINDTQEIVVKPLGSQLNGLRCYAGATIMGDGRVALILDVTGIARASGVLSDSQTVPREVAPLAAKPKAEIQKLLLFKVGRFERVAVPLSLVARLEDIDASRIERAAGSMAVQYRGKILPLLSVAEHLDQDTSHELPSGPVHVVVFADGERRIGLIVDEIIDVVEDCIAIKGASQFPGLLGSAVIGGKLTDFLDISAVIQSFDPTWLEHGTAAPAEATVLLADESSFSRGLIRGYMEIAGHRVVEASDYKDALAKLHSSPVNVVVTSLDLPAGGALALLQSIRETPSTSHLPVIGLGSREIPGSAVPFTEMLNKFDRVAMLRSLERLSLAVDRRSLQLVEV